MANTTNPAEQPVETTAPVPVATAPIQTAPVSTPPPTPILPTLNPAAVYDKTNIQQINIPSSKSAMNMKLSKLESKLAKANSLAELNQIAIMNQPKAMGVLTGEAAYRSKLDTARINAFNSLYQNRLAEEQRKEDARQKFIQIYGADPSMRPKGMSKNEFAKALNAGQFQNLMAPEFREARASAARAGRGGAGTVGQRAGSVIAQAQTALLSSRGEDRFVDPGVYAQYRAQYASQTGDVSGFDSQFAGLLSPQEQSNLGIMTKPTNSQTESTPDQEKTQQSLDTLESAIKLAETHAGASGRSGLRKSLESWFIGSTDYTNLVAETNTIRTNILTLATDPSIKKFFGPQMSNADVQLMTSAGTMLNPELQSPEELKKSLEQAKDLIRRARQAVIQGQQQENLSGQTNTGNNWQVQGGVLPSGNKFTIIQKP